MSQNPFHCRGRGQGRGGRGGRHPAGLTGREIGMYYRNKQRVRREEEESTGGIRLNPSVDIPPDVLRQVHKCLEAFEQQNQEERVCHEFQEYFHHLLDVNFEEFLEECKRQTIVIASDTERTIVTNSHLKIEMQRNIESDGYQKKLKQRQKLPTMEQSDAILKAIHDNQIVLVVGSTGCGKTTQIPQLILDDYILRGKGSECRIVCTQPRRISAISVAERVAYERNESLGNSVGYQIRLESRMPREIGSILYCTTGILLQKMQTDPLMSGLTAVILDEIHERSVETDILMGLLKIILPYRPDLKVILMSATVSEETFCEYFNNCHTLYIQGTLFPVDVLYLEDILQETGFDNFQNGKSTVKPQQSRYRKRETQISERNIQYSRMIESYVPSLRDHYDRRVIDTLRQCPESEGCSNLNFLEYLIFYICEHKPPGAILVFLPGFERISKLNEQLLRPTNPRHQHLAHSLRVYPLHSMMPTVNQRAVFDPPSSGVRKVILSTILAETSVTIEDVVYVINTGRTKISDYDIEQNIQTLEEQWVSKANSQQRKGRAGRVQPGVCYNLFTRVRERTMHDIPLPEILRSKMESIILLLKLLHIKHPYEFLKTLINVPDMKAINHGLRLLKCVEALDENCNLTPLGLHLARLPIDPQMGKMILMAALFRCLDPITSAAAGISFKSPFYTPLGLEQKVDGIKRDLSMRSKSDHLLIHNVIKGYRVAREVGQDMNFCYKNFLSKTTVVQIENMKQQFADVLRSSRFLESSDCCADNSNINSHNIPLLRAIIASGLYPNLAFLRKTKQVGRRVHAIHKMSTPVDRKVNFHPSSVNSGEASFDSNYFVYFQKQRSSDVYLLDATMVFPIALLIFGDGVKQGQLSLKEPYISVADTYFFKCNKDTSSVILKLRELFGILLRKKALHPSPIEPNSKDEQLIKAIDMLLSLDDNGEHVDRFPSTDDDDDDDDNNGPPPSTSVP